MELEEGGCWKKKKGTLPLRREGPLFFSIKDNWGKGKQDRGRKNNEAESKKDRATITSGPNWEE